MSDRPPAITKGHDHEQVRPAGSAGGTAQAHLDRGQDQVGESDDQEGQHRRTSALGRAVSPVVRTVDGRALPFRPHVRLAFACVRCQAGGSARGSAPAVGSGDPEAELARGGSRLVQQRVASSAARRRRGPQQLRQVDAGPRGWRAQAAAVGQVDRPSERPLGELGRGRRSPPPDRGERRSGRSNQRVPIDRDLVDDGVSSSASSAARSTMWRSAASSASRTA